jgi:UDP-2,4-diacetamido-2,4,6-trideoxy-beta-L-altropyranose hydrolase
MRCLTLADALRERGAQTVFICRDLPGFSPQLVLDRGHKLHLLSASEETIRNTDSQPPHATWLRVSWNRDSEETQHILKALESVDYLIVDHYALDSRWEASMRSFVRRIMVIDDLADRKHDCDLLLDQTLAATKANYISLVSEGCTLLLGPQYAMLRPQFVEYRKKAFEKRCRTKKIQRILIAMGGTDPFNMTSIVLKGLELLKNSDLNVTVVLSSSAPHLDVIKKLAENMDVHVSVLSDVPNMAELMLEHDLCIGGGGMTSWERCAMCLPAVTITLAKNQEQINFELERIGASKSLGWFDDITQSDIRDIVMNVMKNISVYHEMVCASHSVCDGQGTQRILLNMGKNYEDFCTVF